MGKLPMGTKGTVKGPSKTEGMVLVDFGKPWKLWGVHPDNISLELLTLPTGFKEGDEVYISELKMPGDDPLPMGAHGRVIGPSKTEGMVRVSFGWAEDMLPTQISHEPPCTLPGHSKTDQNLMMTVTNNTVSSRSGKPMYVQVTVQFPAKLPENAESKLTKQDLV